MSTDEKPLETPWILTVWCLALLLGAMAIIAALAFGKGETVPVVSVLVLAVLCSFSEHVAVTIPDGPSVSASVMVCLAAVVICRADAPLLGSDARRRRVGNRDPADRAPPLAPTLVQHRNRCTLDLGGRVVLRRGRGTELVGVREAVGRHRRGDGVLGRERRAPERRAAMGARSIVQGSVLGPLGLHRRRDRDVRRPRRVPRRALRRPRHRDRGAVRGADPRRPPGLRRVPRCPRGPRRHPEDAHPGAGVEGSVHGRSRRTCRAVRGLHRVRAGIQSATHAPPPRRRAHARHRQVGRPEPTPEQAGQAHAVGVRAGPGARRRHGRPRPPDRRARTVRGLHHPRR